MRRKDREITCFSEIVMIMKRCEVCHVAFFDSEYPYVVPMNFGLQVNDQDIALFFHGASIGKKHDLIKKNNKVGFAMESTPGIVTGPAVGACEYTMEFESVMGTGIIDYVDECQKRSALYTLLEHYNVGADPDYSFSAEVVHRTAVLRLEVHDLTAKKRTPP